MVNQENVLALAEFIEGGSVPFSFDLDQCFIGQLQAQQGRSMPDGKIATHLGIDRLNVDKLCYYHRAGSVWDIGLALSAQDAVRVLRHLADTGEVVHPSKLEGNVNAE